MIFVLIKRKIFQRRMVKIDKVTEKPQNRYYIFRGLKLFKTLIMNFT